MEDKELDLYVLLTDWHTGFNKFSVINIEYVSKYDWYVAYSLDGTVYPEFPLGALVSRNLIKKLYSGLVLSSADKEFEELTTDAFDGLAQSIVEQVQLWEDGVPELTDEWFEKAWQHEGGEVVKEGEGKNPLDVQTGGTHYKDRGIQPIEYIMANNLDFCQGNVIKYVTRHSYKSGKEDLEKARHYIDFLIYQYEQENQND